MKTIWKGAISFGLVNIPVKLSTATSPNNISFKLLHSKCNTPVNNKRYCPHCKEDVDYGDLVKGYEYEDNRFVILNNKDFDNIPVKSTKTIDIIDFVKLEEIDPIYYIKTYYLSSAEGGEKPYLLLKNAMKETNKVAITKITIRNKESLAIIRVMDDLLALETMYFAQEIRPAEELTINNIEDRITVSNKEEKLAVEIVNNLTAKFEPEKYVDEYRETLMKIIREKIEGKEVKVTEAVMPETRVLDLMERLQASVEASEKKKKKTREKTG